MKYTIGCDPELFPYNKKVKRFLSAHPWIKGTKDDPWPVENGATQLDGVSAEFNIFPCKTALQFKMRIASVVAEMQSMINHDDIELLAVPVADFDMPYFKMLPEHVKKLGCSPDFNAYTGLVNDPPSTDEPFRTGSGHVHVGYNTSTPIATSYELDVQERVKQLDYTLFPLSLLWDKDDRRRTLYGAPGAFRYKPYGFEYRVLSNAWVAEPELQEWVFNATVKAMELYDEGFVLFEEEPLHDDIPMEDLVDYHDSLVNEYGFPPLPRAA